MRDFLPGFTMTAVWIAAVWFLGGGLRDCGVGATPREAAPACACTCVCPDPAPEANE